MKRFSILALCLTITLTISACGARGTPAHTYGQHGRYPGHGRCSSLHDDRGDPGSHPDRHASPSNSHIYGYTCSNHYSTSIAFLGSTINLGSRGQFRWWRSMYR